LLTITNKYIKSLQFNVNDYLALLVTLLIRRDCHLSQIAYTINMFVGLRSWLPDDIFSQLLNYLIILSVM